MESKRFTVIDPKDWLSEERLLLLNGWSRDGYTFKDIAQRIGITGGKLRQWRDDYPEIREALAKGREIVDYQVENSLLKAALGYRTKEVTIITVLRNGKLVETTKQSVTKDVAPNVNACQTWLYNRLPNKWKNMHAKANILDDLSKDNNADISITVTRAGSNKDGLVEDKEWKESVNKSVTLRKKTEEEKKAEKANRPGKVIDLDYWPEDWEEE